MLTFAPDAQDIAPEILREVSAVPTNRGYATPPAGVATAFPALADPSQGGALMLELDGSVRTIVGTASKLYEATGSSWADVSRGGNYTSGSARWRFAQFGNDTFCVNKATQLQKSTTGAFADNANSPKAACLETAAGFMLMANTDDTGTGLSTAYGDSPARWWCSQIFNPSGTWAPSVSTQATSGLLVDTPGAIVALKRLQQDCIAYKNKSVYVGRYVGAPVVWQWQCVSTDVGSASGDGVASAGAMHYFLSDDEFYQFDGARAVPIGGNIKKWFFARLNKEYISRVQALHDRARSRIFWFYPTSGSALTSAVVYHYETQRWGAFDINVTDSLEAVTSGITYDNIGTLFSTYDDLPSIAYDDPYWTANNPVLSYITPTQYLYTLSGSATQMTMQTGWMGDENTVSVCTRLRPRFRTAPASGALSGSTVRFLGGSTSTGTVSSLWDGRFDVLQSGRYHSFALTFVGNSEVEAITPTLVPQGKE